MYIDNLDLSMEWKLGWLEEFKDIFINLFCLNTQNIGHRSRLSSSMKTFFITTINTQAMEPWHADVLENNLNDNLKAKHHLTLLGLWSPSKRPYLADPYGRTDEYFNFCFEYIEKSVYEIEKKIKGH